MRNFFEARKWAKNKKPEVIEEPEKFDFVHKRLAKYFFDLQSRREKGGGMDYYQYARIMWTELVGPITEHNQEYFDKFESAMIAGLHGIDMKPLVYEHLLDNLVDLVKKYQDSVKHVALWSTGDVESTGYQLAKTLSSGIVLEYHRALKAGLGDKQKASEIMKEKTSYLVEDDKFKALGDYVEKILVQKPDEKLKIVIIEDSSGNFDKARKSLDQRLGEKSKQVEIIPIWSIYSREGKQAEEKAVDDASREALEKKKKELNAIGSFAELVDGERFAEIFKDAHVFVDFDGVIGNNIEMRERQAEVIYNALMGFARQSDGVSEVDELQKMKANIDDLEREAQMRA